MKVAERMRRDGWVFRPAVTGLAPTWRHRNLSGMLGVIMRQGRSAFVGKYEVCEVVYSGQSLGLRDLAQRAKAAARKLARKRRTI